VSGLSYHPPYTSVVSTLVPDWRERRPSRVRPGITGWAQVRFGYAENYHETREKRTYVLCDMKYVGLALDLRVAALTAGVLINGKSARRIVTMGS
jgi:lipopolysaccharide/colanic/teichoic acid biosynthesis glycosyltransferase